MFLFSARFLFIYFQGQIPILNLFSPFFDEVHLFALNRFYIRLKSEFERIKVRSQKITLI